MENTKRNYVRRAALALATFAALASIQSQSQSLRVTEVKRLANGQAQITATGSSSATVTLEATSNFQSWEPVATFAANTTTMNYTDTNAVGQNFRHYRLRVGGSVSPNPTPTPTTLPDLAGYPNRVFTPADNTTTLQYAADGKLAFTLWRDHDLIVRERTASGSWSEYTLNSLGGTFVPLLSFNYSGPRDDFSFQPGVALVYDSQSRAHVFCGSGSTLIHYVKNGATFTEAERIATPSEVRILNVAIGAGDVLHYAALSSGWTRTLTYGSNKSGTWRFDQIAQINDAPLQYWAPPFAPRWMGLAVDSRNNGHIVFRPEMITTTAGGLPYPRAYSQVWYASNVSGSWTKQLVQQPFDTSAEAANGASIAVGPDDKARIVSWYDERAETGSAQESRLYYHQQDASGNWSATIVARTADNYAAGDGNKGTGFSPLLKFDNRGRAHIVFLDAAGEHFANIGQQEYAGNVRHAWLNGSDWSFETVYRQTSPLQEQAVYPTFAMSGSELAVTFVDRKTQWNLTSYPPMSVSTYYYRFLTAPLK